PVLHGIGDFRGRSNQAEAAHAGNLLIELPDRRVLPFHAFEELRADAAQLCRPELVEWNGTIERIAGQIAEGLVEPCQSNERIEELLELVVFRPRLRGCPAHYGSQSGQDLQVAIPASMLRHAS